MSHDENHGHAVISACWDIGGKHVAFYFIKLVKPIATVIYPRTNARLMQVKSRKKRYICSYVHLEL